MYKDADDIYHPIILDITAQRVDDPNTLQRFLGGRIDSESLVYAEPLKQKTFFQTRIVGLVSYLGDKKELMPILYLIQYMIFTFLNAQLIIFIRIVQIFLCHLFHPNERNYEIIYS
jgi:hypothetical protein